MKILKNEGGQCMNKWGFGVRIRYEHLRYYYADINIASSLNQVCSDGQHMQHSYMKAWECKNNSELELSLESAAY